LQNNVELNRYFSILWGGEYEHKEGVNVGGTSFGDGFHELTDNEAFFLQGIFEYQNNLILTAGFREDINSTFDEITTYKFDAGYRLAATNTKLHMSYSKGFRAPSFNELFAPPAPGGGGLRTSNPLLQPEVIKSFEVGMKQDFMDKRIQLALTFFNSVTSNFIQSAPTTFVQENLGKLRSKGLETSVDIKLPYHLSLSIRILPMMLVNNQSQPVSSSSIISAGSSIRLLQKGQHSIDCFGLLSIIYLIVYSSSQ
jgi:vitamin B12 transporter